MASSPRRRPSRIFVDSSVFIAAAISETGRARDLFRRSFHSELILLVSPLVLEETLRNLAGKAPEALPAFQILRDVLSATSVNPPRRLVLRVAQIVPVKDAPIVAAALHSRASYLATYDRRHLLSLKEDILAHFGLEVLTPDEILSRIP